MKGVVEYQPIVDEYFREKRMKQIVLRMPRRKKEVRKTTGDLAALNLPDTTPMEAEWSDGKGYHRAKVTGVWESESGSVVLTVGAEQVVPERGIKSCTTTMK